MKSSKAIYFLMTGAIIAALALFVVFYETETLDDKEVVVPLVKKVVDAKPIEVKQTREETTEKVEYEQGNPFGIENRIAREKLYEKTEKERQ